MKFALKSSSSFYLTKSTYGTHSANRATKTLRKIISGRDKGKKNWYLNSDSPKLPSPVGLSKNKGQGKESNRRIAMLNKLFMQNITDLMATGDVSERLLGRGLEVSRVKVGSDFQGVNVYWLAKGNDNDDEIQTVLNLAAHSIRHELSQLRLMGEVPKITFVKDRFYAKVMEVDHLLGNADLGEANSDLLEDGSEVDEHDLPEMRNDVFGLNQSEIMERISRRLKRSKNAWEKYEMGSLGVNTNADEEEEKVNLESVNAEVDAMKLSDNGFAKYLERKSYKKPTPDRKKHITEKVYLKADELEVSFKESLDFIEEIEEPRK